jgi:hypothetical protein
VAACLPPATPSAMPETRCTSVSSRIWDPKITLTLLAVTPAFVLRL